jgi:type II secretory pathway pseudopilin PulG
MKNAEWTIKGKGVSGSAAGPLKVLRSRRGASLVEVLVASGIALIVFASILSTVMGISAMTVLARHYTQAMHVVRGEAEELKGIAFDNIVNANSQVSFDAGPDNVFGTLDDLTGTLQVAVRDALDMDGDNNTVEAAIDVNGDGVNDCLDFPACDDPYTKPVRVTFTWNERLWSVNKNLTVVLDTLVSQ